MLNKSEFPEYDVSNIIQETLNFCAKNKNDLNTGKEYRFPICLKPKETNRQVSNLLCDWCNYTLIRGKVDQCKTCNTLPFLVEQNKKIAKREILPTLTGTLVFNFEDNSYVRISASICLEEG
jgi:hypothetical protein